MATRNQRIADLYIECERYAKRLGLPADEYGRRVTSEGVFPMWTTVAGADARINTWRKQDGSTELSTVTKMRDRLHEECRIHQAMKESP